VGNQTCFRLSGGRVTQQKGPLVSKETPWNHTHANTMQRAARIIVAPNIPCKPGRPLRTGAL